MKFMEYLDKLWDEAVEWFEDVGEDIVGFVKPLAKQIKKNGGPLLLEAAYLAVLAAEQSGGSGRDKFEAAQNSVKATLTAKGLPIVINAVNGAIEMAVAKLKEQ